MVFRSVPDTIANKRLLFFLRKYVELGDSVFILCRKRPLVFLQRYHHMLTCWVNWIIALLVEPVVRWFVALNYAVHSVMYPYFDLKAHDVSRTIPNTSTSMELLQMVIGRIVNRYTMFLIRDSHCTRHPVTIKAFMLLYDSFTVRIFNIS